MKVNFTLFRTLVLISAVGVSTAKAQTVNTIDSLALVDLYKSTHGDMWTTNTNWLTTAPVSIWFGVTVTDSSVTSISLQVNNMIGTLPSSIGNFTNLQHVNFYNNLLSGSIPLSIGKLTNLIDLMLGYNRLAGSLPSSLGKLIKLQNLDLAGNRLSDSIPLSIGNLVNVQYLNISSNHLAGAIPSTISKLGKIQILELSDNQLSGLIPSTIGKLNSVQYIYLQNNQLSGSIPASIGNLVALQYLYLNNNNLSGTLTSSLGNLTNLQLLFISNNAFTGSIPSSFGKLIQLAYLYINDNQLTGIIPASLSKLVNLQYINLSNNHLQHNINKTLPLPQNTMLHANISNNNFTFDGLEPTSLNYPYISYSPQAIRLTIHQVGDTLSVTAGGTESKNTYTWYQAGTSNSTVVTGDSMFHPAASGQYYAQVRNANATQLILFTDTITYTNSLLTNKTATSFFINHKTDVFTAYPNPARDIVHITVSGSATLALLNADGKIMMVKNITGKDEIDVGRFVTGTYYLQNKSTGKVQKIIVIH